MKLKSLCLGVIILLNFSCITYKDREKFNSQSLFLTDSIYSLNLSEIRKHNIYIPAGFDKNKIYPIIYATDGNDKITAKKDILDSLISRKIIQPIIFVASFSNNNIADSTSMETSNGEKFFLPYRYFDYVDRHSIGNYNPKLANRFRQHKSYFIEELIPNFEKRFNQNHGKNNRYFYGVSNGAGFGLELLNKNPSIIGTYICFSTVGGNIQENEWKKDVDYPVLFLRYGSEEDFLKGDADFLNSKFNEIDQFIEVKEFEGGHNNSYWNKEFIDIISRLFEKK